MKRIHKTLFNWRWWVVMPLIIALFPFAILAWVLGLIADHSEAVYDFYTYRLLGWVPYVTRWARGDQ